MSKNTQPTSHLLVGGLDVGNGYVKGVIAGYGSDGAAEPVVNYIDLPSAVVSTPRATLKVPAADADAVRVMVEEDIFNNLAASFTTPLVSQSDLRIFGRAALASKGSKFTQFDVIGQRSKADQELSFVLVLGLFAAKAVRDHVRAHGALPTTELTAHVHAGLALPIDEFVARRHGFAARFSGTHLVTVKNFTTPVTVRLTFAEVQVLPEGASAQFAIADKGVELAKALLADLRADAATTDPAGAASLAQVTPEALVAVRNTIGVDVGEGTTNFAVFTDGAFNAEASRTLDRGYGMALTNALEQMNAHGDRSLSFASRKALADFLQSEPSVFLQARHDAAAGFVETEAEYLVADIISAFEDVLIEIGGSTEVVYVYGGGSGAIKHLLRPALQGAASGIPVLYLDASFSRHLNREGLYMAAELSQKKAAEQSAGAA